VHDDYVTDIACFLFMSNYVNNQHAPGLFHCQLIRKKSKKRNMDVRNSGMRNQQQPLMVLVPMEIYMQSGLGTSQAGQPLTVPNSTSAVSTTIMSGTTVTNRIEVRRDHYLLNELREKTRLTFDITLGANGPCEQC
jgi:hypothetical protein